MRSDFGREIFVHSDLGTTKNVKGPLTQLIFFQEMGIMRPMTQKLEVVVVRSVVMTSLEDILILDAMPRTMSTFIKKKSPPCHATVP